MRTFETGLFLDRIPFVKMGSGAEASDPMLHSLKSASIGAKNRVHFLARCASPILVLNGGQAFVRRPTPARAKRDGKRIARLLPKGRTVYVLGYDPAPSADHSIETIVRDVAQIMRDVTGPATVMGISFGGFVAARLAADHPDLVRELILMVSAHRFSPDGRRSVDRQLEYAWAGDFEKFLDEFGLVFRRPWLNWLIRLRLRKERSRLCKTMNDPAVIVRGLNAVAGEDFGSDPAWLARITAPTLIVGATRDPFFDVAALEETARHIPCAQLKLFERETHMLPVERARDVAKVVTRFLQAPRCV